MILTVFYTFIESLSFRQRFTQPSLLLEPRKIAKGGENPLQCPGEPLLLRPLWRSDHAVSLQYWSKRCCSRIDTYIDVVCAVRVTVYIHM